MGALLARPLRPRLFVHHNKSPHLKTRLLSSIFDKPQLHHRRPQITNNQNSLASRTHRRTLFSQDPQAVTTSALAFFESLFTNIHLSTGLPCYATILLTALLLTVAFRLPAQLFVESGVRRRASLTPLLRALRARHTNEVGREIQRGQLADANERVLQNEIQKRYGRSEKELFGRWACQRWKNYLPLASLPFWLLGIESVRRMCGGGRGLIGTLVFGSAAPTSVRRAGTAAESSASAPAEGLVDVTACSAGAVEPVLSAAGTLDLACSNQTAAHLSKGFVDSLTTGGCLWFPDLTASDPYHVLPLALSAVLFLNLAPPTLLGMRKLLLAGDSGSSQPQSRRNKLVLRFQRVFLVMALAVGPATLDIPAAIHLYWISTALFSLIRQMLLQRSLKSLAGSDVKPCKGGEPFLILPRPENSRGGNNRTQP